MPRAVQLRMRIRICLTVALAGALLAPAARADRRTMIRAYEYMTQPQGNLELELWNDVSAPVAGGFDQASTLQRIELEYGLTDHWDLALYHGLRPGPGCLPPVRLLAPGDPVTASSRRTSCRWNVMLYFELERPANFTEPWVIEEKLILEKDFGRFALVANLAGKQKPFHGKPGLPMGDRRPAPRYEVVPQLRLGAEFWTIQENGGRVHRGQLLPRARGSPGPPASSGCRSRRLRHRRVIGVDLRSARCWGSTC